MLPSELELPCRQLLPSAPGLYFLSEETLKVWGGGSVGWCGDGGGVCSAGLVGVPCRQLLPSAPGLYFLSEETPKV